MQRENRIMYARKHCLERNKRAYVHRKRILHEGIPAVPVEDEEEEDPLVIQEVEEEVEAVSQTSYRVYDEENEEEG